MRLARLLAVALVVVFPLVSVRVALAHASLVKADPAPGSIFKVSPDRVTIWFAEPVEPRFSSIQVLDAQAGRVDGEDVAVDGRDPTMMSVSLHPLSNGTYTVIWKTVSEVDGHATGGYYVFSVGENSGGAVAVPPPQPPPGPSPLEPVMKWLVFLGALGLVGRLGFDILVLRATFRGSGARDSYAKLGARLESRLPGLILLSAGLALAGSIGQLAVQAAAVQGLPWYEVAGGTMLAVVNETTWGHVWLWRVGLLLAAGAAGVVGVKSGRMSLRAVSLGLGALALFTLSLVSHAVGAAGIGTEAVFSDYLHLLAEAFWVGGLFFLASTLPLISRSLSRDDRGAFLSSLTRRFSPLALLSVGTLIITGSFAAWVEVGSLPALRTQYGTLLLIKAGLIVPLLALGALNSFRVRPRLGNDARAGWWLWRISSGEAVLAALVLLSAGVLTSLEPAHHIATDQGVGGESGLTLRDTGEEVNTTVQITPAQVGANRFVVILEDRQGNPINNAWDVSVSLTYRDADLGANVAPAKAAGYGTYVLDGSLLPVSGPWQAEIVVRRPDAFDARSTFQINITPTGVLNRTPAAPSHGGGNGYFDVELGLLAALFLVVRLWFTPPP